MQKQTALLGLKAMTRRAIRFQGAFVILDLIFRLAARAGALPLEYLGAGLLEVGHDKARVDALRRHLNLDHHPARLRPRPGLITGRVEASDLAAIARLGTFGLFDDLVSQLLQDTIAGQPGHIMEVGLRLDPLHHLGVGKMAVTANDHQGVRPSLTKTLEKPFQHAEHLRSTEALGLENRGNQTA